MGKTRFCDLSLGLLFLVLGRETTFVLWLAADCAFFFAIDGPAFMLARVRGFEPVETGTRDSLRPKS